MNNTPKAIAVLICTVALSTQAVANYTCTGKVSGVSISPKNGQLLVERIGTLKWVVLCSVETEINKVSANTCSAIYSLLITAQVSGKQATLWFNDGRDCSKTSHKPWQKLTGWYFGPRLQD